MIPFISWIAESIHKDWIRFFHDGNMALSLSVTAISLIYLILAFRRFFQQDWILIALKAFIFWLLFGEVVLYIYRVIIFKLTMLFI